MNSEDMLDSRLSERLSDVSWATGPRPDGDIRHGAARLRRRRTARRTAGAVALVGVLAVPVAGGLLEGAGTQARIAPGGSSSTSDAPTCEGEGGGAAWPVDPAALPAGLVATWGDPLPAPDAAFARQEKADCVPSRSWRWVDVEGGRVERIVGLSHTPADAETLEEAGAYITVEQIGERFVRIGQWPDEPDAPIQARWTEADGQAWTLSVSGTDRVGVRDVRDLVAGLYLSERPLLRPSTAPAAVEPLQVARETAETYSWEVERVMSEDDGSQLRLRLETTAQSDPVLAQVATVGDRLVDVNGEQGVQRRDGSVSWMPRAGVLAHLMYKGDELDAADLLAGARSVRAVEPDAELRKLLR